MVEYIFVAVIALLLSIIVVQAIERFHYADQMNGQQQKLIAAILSKNANEYTQVIKAEKEPAPESKANDDEVELSNADDKTFMSFIKTQTQ